MDEAAAPLEEASTGRRKRRWRRRVNWTAALVVLLAAGLVLPPLINVGNYKRQITALMSRSLGRPVRLSSVELRLLPMPGFVLHDLQVSEDPEFGAEPVLSARTVVASIRVPSLWRGRIEISRVSVDQASLNLVRSADGRWNLDALMMGGMMGSGLAQDGAAHTGPNRANGVHFPYLEATDSRVNVKEGAEKTPFALLETDLSLWQDAPGLWRVRLRGQPMRTDIPMSLADTGEVRLEASLHSAAQLRDMPLTLDMEWRNAQLGQLSRLITGSDAGWRGDLTLDVAVQGTPDSAQTKARLRATGVRREEFAPATPLDFDANCAFRYQHSLNAAHDVNCNTAIGDGLLHLKGDLPGKAGPPEAMLEVKDLPLQAGLDLLRTVRGGFAPGMSARGTVNGSLTYKQVAASALAAAEQERARKRKAASAADEFSAVPGDLQGALTVAGAELSGGQLTEALKLPEITLTPTMVWDVRDTDGSKPAAIGSPALMTNFTVGLGQRAAEGSTPGADPASDSAAGAASNAAVTLYLYRQRYQIGLKGAASIAKLRELGYGFGWPHRADVDALTGGTAEFELSASGPWIDAGDAGNLSGLAPSATATGTFDASLTLHHTEWHADYLLHPVELTRATVDLGATQFHLDSDFTFGGKAKDAAKGALHGAADISASSPCGGDAEAAGGEPETELCAAKVEIRLGAVDAAVLESALLGTPEEKSLLSPLMDRMRSSDQPKWPPVALHVQADSLALGPVTLQKPEADIRFEQGAAVVEHWDAGLLGGTAEGAGRLGWADGKPQYAFHGSFAHLNAALLGSLLGNGWTGGPLNGDGSVELSGRSGADLAASATGTLHFEWQHGAGLAVADGSQSSFDGWSGDATIQGGKAVLGENTLLVRRKLSTLAGTIPFSGPAALTATAEGGKPAPAATSSPKQAVK
jgi:hypothetical protein